jgi:hypothetical protein
MLTEVADGVWVRQSAWAWTNSIVVPTRRQVRASAPAHGPQLATKQASVLICPRRESVGDARKLAILFVALR